MRRFAALALSAAVAAGCSSSTPTPAPVPQAARAAETTSPKDSPVAYRVLADQVDKNANSVEFHVLIAADTKHDDVEKLLKYLYRHLTLRTEEPPAALAAYVYTNEAQYSTPPRSPLASVIKRAGALGPTFMDKVPLEFWQQVDEALPHADKGWKLAKQITRDDANRTLQIVVPYTAGKDEWAPQLSFTQAINVFTETARALFDKVPELRAMTFIGRYRDADVVKISLDRAMYETAQLDRVEDEVGQAHGQAFLALSYHKTSDQAAERAVNHKVAAIYRKMLGHLKGHAHVSPKLK